jgi:hypothetical protein
VIQRMLRAAQLDVNVYEELEHDPTLNNQAMTVVALVAVLTGIGTFITAVFVGDIVTAIVNLVVGIIMTLIGWGIWAWLTYFIGTRLFNGTATWGELLRTLGFAYTPQVLGIFLFIPCVGALLWLAAWVWSIVAGVVAVRQALDFDTGKAVLTVVIAAVVVLVLIIVVTTVLAIAGVGLNLVTGGGR